MILWIISILIAILILLFIIALTVFPNLGHYVMMGLLTICAIAALSTLVHVVLEAIV